MQVYFCKKNLQDKYFGSKG